MSDGRCTGRLDERDVRREFWPHRSTLLQHPHFEIDTDRRVYQLLSLVVAEAYNYDIDHPEYAKEPDVNLSQGAHQGSNHRTDK